MQSDWLTALDSVFWGNAVRVWIVAFVTAGGGYLLLWTARTIGGGYLQKLAGKTPMEIDNFVADLVSSIHPVPMLCVTLWLASSLLRLPPSAAHIFQVLPWVACLLQLALWAGRFADFLFGRYLASRASEAERLTAKTMLGPVRAIAMLVFWLLLLAIGLQNMGMNVTALITGLGIGGVAVALAVQNTLKDVIGAFSIVMDKPFIVGDFIGLDDFSGTVQHIGIKNTRIRAVGGEELIVPNGDLLKGRIRNFRRMMARRVSFQMTLDHDVPIDKLSAAALLAKEVVESQGPPARFDRAHICAFTLTGRTLEVVYFVESPDFNQHMDVLQAIQLELARKLEEAQVILARNESLLPRSG
ncbi:MAG: mechanosensitive ion channel family protein [Vampirovibrionales bacterium]|nr:mechanosensitive ion channel family protein [Vampirovibrionales bacterium]